MKSGHNDDLSGNFISIDATKRNHDERLNDVMNEFSSKKSSVIKKETLSKSQKGQRSVKNFSDDDDDIVGMMDKLNK